MASGLSKYATRHAARVREDNGALHPMPRPFSWGYFPTHACSIETGRDDQDKLLPHEFKNGRQIAFFRMPHRA